MCPEVPKVERGRDKKGKKYKSLSSTEKINEKPNLEQEREIVKSWLVVPIDPLS